jgi:phage baseplate assembly protein W
VATDYGTELSLLKDIASDSRTVSGFRVVGEAIFRRLTTPRGRLIADPNYGFDLTQYVNADMSPRDIAGLRSGIAAECVKDERVNAVTVDATLERNGLLTVSIVLDLGTQTFTLVIAASSVTVDLVRVNQ